MIAVALFLRLGRWGITGLSVLAFVTTLAFADAFYAIAGYTTQERGAFGRSITELASHFTAILPPPVHPETVEGFVEWRGFHALAIVVAVWAFVSATALVRIDEERGVVEAMLATGVSRIQALAARAAAYAVGLSVACVAAAAGFALGVRSAGGVVDPRGVLEASLLLGLLALCCYALSLLVAQLLPARTATAGAGAVLLTLFLLESLSRTFDSLSTVRWLSPFRYYDLSLPLSPGGAFDPRSIIVLAATSILATTAAAWAFRQRDLGSPLLPIALSRQLASYEPSRALWLRVTVLREIYLQRVGLVAWCIAVTVLAAIFVSETKTVIQPLLSLPSLLPYFGLVVRGNIYPAVLGFTWLNIAELLFAGFAISQVARWSAEDVDGRLEAILSQPRSRAGVLLERVAVLVIAATVMAALSGVALVYTSRSQGIDLDSQRAVTASMLLVPFALIFAGVGALLAAWNPRAAVGLLSGVAFLSFLDTEVGPLLRFPAWLLDLSAFKLFGNPLAYGLDNRSLAIMLAIVLAGLASSILAMQVRDVGA